MKTINFLYLESCPYCKNARRAMDELRAKNPLYEEVFTNMKWIEESKDEAARDFAHAYYYVPTMIVEGKKLYEAHPGESYEECKEKVEAVFKEAAK